MIFAMPNGDPVMMTSFVYGPRSTILTDHQFVIPGVNVIMAFINIQMQHRGCVYHHGGVRAFGPVRILGLHGLLDSEPLSRGQCWHGARERTVVEARNGRAVLARTPSCLFSILSPGTRGSGQRVQDSRLPARVGVCSLCRVWSALQACKLHLSRKPQPLRDSLFSSLSHPFSYHRFYHPVCCNILLAPKTPLRSSSERSELSARSESSRNLQARQRPIEHFSFPTRNMIISDCHARPDSLLSTPRRRSYTHSWLISWYWLSGITPGHTYPST